MHLHILLQIPLAKLFNKPELVERVITSIRSTVSQDPFVEQYLTQVYQDKIDSGMIKKLKIYVVPNWIINNRFTHIAGFYYPLFSIMFISEKYIHSKSTPIHEILHYLSDNHLNRFSIKRILDTFNWKYYNEFFTEYLTHIWILKESSLEIQTGYNGPYLQMHEFFREIDLEIFRHSYFYDEKETIKNFIENYGKISINKFLYYIKNLQEHNTITQTEFSLLLQKIANEYMKEKEDR